MLPKIYNISDHDIDPTFLDSDAIYVIKKLKDAGFISYLVGGSVRDLLLKRTPKDFDISTSARPEQIKQLFNRNCLLIGRRFRLAHLRFGHKILEVSTFRSGENDSDLIIHDNSWGTPEEDVLRRDFTVNGLYYDPEDHTIIDYVGGWEDIHKNTLRTIGEPTIRFKQDPVRMIRLLKFKSRFDFKIDQQTSNALSKCLHEIVKSSPARILEEILRMLESGSSEPFFRLMTETGLLELLFPCLTYFLQGPHAEEVYQHLAAADTINRSRERRPLDRAVLTSCLLFPILEREIHSRYTNDQVVPNFGQILLLTNSLIHGFMTSSFTHFPKRLSMVMSDILSTQYRLTPVLNKKQSRPRVSHKEFELSLKLLKIRTVVDPSLLDTYDWWYNLYRQNDKHHEKRSHHHHHTHHAVVENVQHPLIENENTDEP